MPADPCMKFACQLQDCLQKKRYQESECADVKEKLLDCCRAHLDESRVCDGFRGHLGRGQERNSESCDDSKSSSKQRKQ
uniref:Cx9C motif-containing protein 4 n=1 Tax=Plectus sambesii TaxID=2011161 RepID=A0A914V523_9BILA